MPFLLIKQDQEIMHFFNIFGEHWKQKAHHVSLKGLAA